MVAINEVSMAAPGESRRRTWPAEPDLYQGMTLDAVAGLCYERFRNYSPTLGTWTSQDPLGYINGANTYQFVDSSPVGSVDPEGEVTGREVLEWVKNTYHQLVPGGEFVDATGAVPDAILLWLHTQADDRAIHDYDNGKCPMDDPFYNALMNMSQGQPLTPAEHAAVQERLDRAS
jgi:RHS repeat-associated protein